MHYILQCMICDLDYILFYVVNVFFFSKRISTNIFVSCNVFEWIKHQSEELLIVLLALCECEAMGVSILILH